MRSMTMKQFRERFKHIPGEIKKRLGPALKPHRQALRKDLVRDMRRTKLGRKLWAKSMRPSGAPQLIVGVGGFRVSRTHGGWIQTARLKGMAALMELGAKTQPHRIRPWQGDRLYFIGKEGHLVAPKIVRHPGGRLKREQVLERNVDRHFPRMLETVAKTLDKSFKKAFGL